MKGHTRIELKDVNTGKVKVIDEDNMVTAGLQKMLQPYPFFTNNIAAISNIIGDVIGGLLLFEDAIEENVNNYIPPSGNKMTGRGMYDVTYSGAAVEAGSFNSVESGLQDDGSVKLVWDFNTSQANGKISCVSLTSLIGGYVGLGDSVYASDISKSLYKQLAQITASSYQMREVVFADYENNIIVFNRPILKADFYDSGIIKFEKFRIPLSNISIFDKCIYLNNRHSDNGIIQIDNSQVLETININLPQKIIDTLGYNGYMYYRGGFVPYNADGTIKYVFGSYSDNIQKSETFYLCLIDPLTGTLTVKDIINATEGYLELGGVQSSRDIDGYGLLFTNRVAVTSKYIVCLSYFGDTWKLCRININDNSDVVDLGFGVSNLSSFSIFFITEDYIFFNYDSKSYVLNVSKCFVCNINEPYSNFFATNLTHARQVKGNDMLVIQNTYYKGSYGAYLTTHPVPILTINNITEPVTKTSAHTMKVTYTLSES